MIATSATSQNWKGKKKKEKPKKIDDNNNNNYYNNNNNIIIIIIIFFPKRRNEESHFKDTTIRVFFVEPWACSKEYAFTWVYNHNLVIMDF